MMNSHHASLNNFLELWYGQQQTSYCVIRLAKFTKYEKENLLLNKLDTNMVRHLGRDGQFTQMNLLLARL